jgi:hypothetical protein
MRNVENPVGLLLTMVPKSFEGESFRQYRDAERRSREAAASAEAEWRREYQRILDDPAASPDDKRLAREILSADVPA